MPFTFAHPAAILPAKYFPKKWVSYTALAMGSMAPDFEYFLRMRNLGIYGHTWFGLLWFDMPVALILTFVYHAVVKNSLIDNLPLMFRQRLNRFKDLNWFAHLKQNFLPVLICIIIGIATHIIWDAFTHRTGYFVTRIPWLQKNTIISGVGEVRFYILQVVSSSVGLILLFYALFMLPKDKTIGKRNIFWYWLTVLCLQVSIVSIRLYIVKHRLPLEHFKDVLKISFYETFFNHRAADDFVMVFFSAFLIALVLAPFIVRKRA